MKNILCFCETHLNYPMGNYVANTYEKHINFKKININHKNITRGVNEAFFIL